MSIQTLPVSIYMFTSIFQSLFPWGLHPQFWPGSSSHSLVLTSRHMYPSKWDLGFLSSVSSLPLNPTFYLLSTTLLFTLRAPWWQGLIVFHSFLNWANKTGTNHWESWRNIHHYPSLKQNHADRLVPHMEPTPPAVPLEPSYLILFSAPCYHTHIFAPLYHLRCYWLGNHIIKFIFIYCKYFFCVYYALLRIHAWTKPITKYCFMALMWSH